MALTYLLIVTLSALLSQCTHVVSADLRSQHQMPPVYVIQDGDTDHLGAGSGKAASRHWNNQKLIQRTPAASSQARSAKQLLYTDEPVPYYHSYKHMGFRTQGESAIDDQYSHPVLGYHHAGGEIASAWHETRQGLLIRPPVGRATKAVGATATGKTRTPGTKVGRRKTSPANRRRFQHSPPVMVPDYTGLANSPFNQSVARRAGPSTGKKNLVCYYGTWAVYRPDAGKYPVENIDPFLCTHIIYGFTGLSYDNLIKPLDPWNDLEDNYGKGAMKRFTNLKRINPDLKTLVAIGGWNEGSIKYSKMASEPESRAKFVASVVEFLDKYDFDGLDLDWEYPGARGGYSYDKQNFVKLLRELKEAFTPQNYLLTAAVSAGKWFIDPAYDIAQVSKYLDLINLMAYDYHGGWETKTGMNAPLFHSPKHDSTKEEAMLNVNWSVNYWLQQGAPAEKIMLGVGSYGRSFTLDKNQVNGINAPASQKGQAGPYTREPGSLGYNEICEAFQRQPEAWTIVREPDYLAPYAYNDRQWVGYDDVESLALKAQFAKSMGLGGMMMWSIETDDFQGRCHGEKYPLLNTIKRVLNGADRPPLTPLGGSSTRRPASGRPTSSSTTTTTTTTSRPSDEGEKEDEPVSSSPPTSSTTSTTRRPTTSRAVPGSTRKPTPATGGSSSTSTRPISSSTSTSTTTSTTRRPVAPAEPGEFVCRADGMFADPRNCRKFIRCVNWAGRAHYLTYRFDCGPGTAFNQERQYCDHIYNVPACKNQAQRRKSSLEANQAHSYNNLMLQHHYNQIHSTIVG